MTLEGIIKDLYSKQDTLIAELDIHKLMLGEWVIKEKFFKFTVNDIYEELQFTDTNAYNYQLSIRKESIGSYESGITNGQSICTTTISYTGRNWFIDLNIGKIEIYMNFLKNKSNNFFIKIRKAPLDAYVREMIDST